MSEAHISSNAARGSRSGTRPLSEFEERSRARSRVKRRKESGMGPRNAFWFRRLADGRDVSQRAMRRVAG